MSFVVAIDGPAGTGKGTVTKLISKKTGLVNIDTGAMYRCVTLECMELGIEPKESESLSKVLEEIQIRLENNKRSSKGVFKW